MLLFYYGVYPLISARLKKLRQQQPTKVKVRVRKQRKHMSSTSESLTESPGESPGGGSGDDGMRKPRGRLRRREA